MADTHKMPRKEPLIHCKLLNISPPKYEHMTHAYFHRDQMQGFCHWTVLMTYPILASKQLKYIDNI